LHELLVFTVNVISTTDTTSSRATTSIVVAPASTTLSVRTIASHMTSVTTDATDNTSSVVLFLRAVVLAVADLATVLASLVFVVSKCTVERGKFTKLIALELVLAFRDRCSLNE
jgi:hypothetical protein